VLIALRKLPAPVSLRLVTVMTAARANPDIVRNRSGKRHMSALAELPPKRYETILCVMYACVHPKQGQASAPDPGEQPENRIGLRWTKGAFGLQRRLEPAMDPLREVHLATLANSTG